MTDGLVEKDGKRSCWHSRYAEHRLHSAQAPLSRLPRKTSITWGIDRKETSRAKSCPALGHADQTTDIEVASLLPCGGNGQKP